MTLPFIHLPGCRTNYPPRVQKNGTVKRFFSVFNAVCKKLEEISGG